MFFQLHTVTFSRVLMARLARPSEILFSSRGMCCNLHSMSLSLWSKVFTLASKARSRWFLTEYSPVTCLIISSESPQIIRLTRSRRVAQVRPSINPSYSISLLLLFIPAYPYPRTSSSVSRARKWLWLSNTIWKPYPAGPWGLFRLDPSKNRRADPFFSTIRMPAHISCSGIRSSWPDVSWTVVPPDSITIDSASPREIKSWIRTSLVIFSLILTWSRNVSPTSSKVKLTRSPF
mmetsp:Transcript_48591/g.146552  ORF Transcript_48591/g.146552 Transcript_48591/m.146552 type:complete len:234 (-) Transcript_48591:387-1088(-)